MTNEPSSPAAGPEIDTSVASSPRIWNYWLGGKDNFEIDRKIGDDFAGIYPPIVDVARASREFLVRAVTHLAGDLGIRQFLDIGTGLPTVNNTHEVAQSVAPDARVVYVDNDPAVLAHARSLLVGARPGSTRYIDADLREPESVVRSASQTLDFTQPIGLMLLNIVGHIPTMEQARSIVRTLVDALPSGSYLVIADSTNVIDTKAITAAVDMWNQAGSLPYHLRTPDQLAEFFDGLTLLEPGIVSCSRWHANTPQVGGTADVDEFGGVGRKD